ncbi:protein kinase domain-containing protein [Lyngbya aestuarii]|uniref:protein kinase domain-containing protein n=1 Tax=Lyngbya aestuarii TaxID=118322 RepID=UPI00403D9511
MNNLLEFDSHGYQVEKELGSNRAGGRVTYLAKDTKTEQLVVIKQFQFVKSGSNWSDYDAHDREIQVLRGLEHPGIPRYLNSFQTSDGFCMVQEYKNASSLSVPRSFSHEQIKQIAVSLLEILLYLQNRIPPVIHRDIKPGNILVDQELRVYLIDFGFARIGDGEVGISSVVKGTLGFMPPEQLFNRQITEASDIYSLGMTLICLLTATKSDDIGQLVDISYRVTFKHLVPKLNFHWIKWLEKMAEPRLKERYPNATVALEAMPVDPLRSPQVKFSQAAIEFRAMRLGEKLTQVITISNPIPETMLTGQWQVSSHVSDPPHTPDFHSWISFKPAAFTSNQNECQITVDTSKLRADKTFVRQVLLRTNSLPETHSLTLQVRTAPIPIRNTRLPFGFLSLTFSFSVIMAWIISRSVLISGTLSGDSVTTGLGTMAGAALGLEAAAWGMATAGMTTGATIGAFAGTSLGVVALAIGWQGAISTTGTATLAGAAAGLVGGLIMGVTTGIAAENLIQRGLTKYFAGWIALLTTAAASCLGIVLGAGFVNTLILSAVVSTSLPLAITLIHLPLQRARLITEYRQAEQHLIKS